MKELTAIRLVQFFLYERQDVALGRTCGIFGANGSGKSSLLDAVQIVMFGASAERGRGVALNAQAEDNIPTTRTIRGYCLGQYGDASDARVRDNATTYITLVWKDSETGEVLSSGVCIAASADREGHDVLGRYLIAGEISLQDHLAVVDGRERPQDWAAFRHQLQQRAQPGEEVFFHEAKRFVTDLLFALRGQAGPAPYEAYRQAFRFALRMRFDEPVDAIVRRQVLEPRPTNIRRFKEVLATFQEMAARVREVQLKLDEALKIEGHFEAAHKSEVHAISWDALERDAQLQASNERLGAAEDAAARAQQALEDAQQAADQAKQGEEAAAKAQADAASARDRHASHTDLALLRSSLGSACQQRDRKRAEVLQNLTALKVSLELPMQAMDGAKAKSDAACAAGLRQIVPLLHAQDLTREALSSAASSGLRALLDKYNESFELMRQSSSELHKAELEAEREQENKARVAKGRAPLEEGVFALQRALADAGISATPVCELVKVTDEAWQPVIEAFLGKSNMQALLVDEADERKAFSIYRAARVFEAKIVMPSRFKDRTSPKAGTVAELIGGHNAAAVNYLRSKLGEFQRAQTEDECFSYRQAMTADGMVVAGGEILRKRPVDSSRFMLGPLSSAAREAAESALKAAVQRLAQAQRRFDAIKALSTSLAPMAGAVEEKVAFFLKLFDEAAQHDLVVQDLQARLQAIQTDEYQALCQAAEDAAQAFRQARAHTDQTNSAAGSAKKEAEALQAAAAQVTHLVRQCEQAAVAARQVSGFDAVYASEQWDRLLLRAEQGHTFASLQAECERRAKRERDEARASANRAQQDLSAFAVRHNEALAEDARMDWHMARTWLHERVQALKDTGLKEYQEQMDDALATAKRTFRTDVAVAIHENVEWLEESLKRMNAALSAAPAFTNGERYRFVRTVRPVYANLLKFIRDVAKYGPEDDLIGGAGEMPAQFEELMRDKATAGNAAERSPLDDYREFFDFDIEVLRVDPQSGVERRFGLLSRRVGSASGGEHRAPLYIIAGAALASAYRAKPGDTSGLRLILLDEAFVRMDANNVIAIMRYLGELGLQVFVASAGDAQATLNAFVDRYYDIMRDAVANVVLLEGHDVDERTREIFREDLPEFNEDLVEQEMAVQSAISGAAA